MARALITRRAFLAGGLALAIVPDALEQRVRRAVRFHSSPFTLGVASGDPRSDSIVLWTRLAPAPLQPDGGMTPEAVEVSWEIAEDDRMSRVVQRGTTLAVPEFAHAVHVEVANLKPARRYWYRFRAANEVSGVGRTRTLPDHTNHLRFAFASCQHYAVGFFTALGHLAAEDVDVAFHLGDYIYESGGSDGQLRRHAGPELVTLEHYRTRYAQYKSDPDLQAAHAALPWIVTWDDHEVSDNYASDHSRQNDPVPVFRKRRAAAYQAYFEHLPLSTLSLPHGAAAQMYRQFSAGALASFFVLDTRQHRSDQPCGGRTGPPCDGIADPRATLLGEVQERWLFDGIGRSHARWTVIPQQVMMAKVDLASGPDERYSMDQWSGYDVPRTRLLQFLATQRARMPVVLTGDIHSNWVNDLKVDFRDPNSPTVATEFVGTSISSGGDGSDLPANIKDAIAENPFVRFHNAQRGYVRCDLTPKAMRADYRVVDYVTRRGAPISTRASFIVEHGRPGAQRDT